MSFLDLFEGSRRVSEGFQPHEGTRLPTWWEWHRTDVGLSVAVLLVLGALLAAILYRRPIRVRVIGALAALLKAVRSYRRRLAALWAEVEKRAAEK